MLQVHCFMRKHPLVPSHIHAHLFGLKKYHHTCILKHACVSLVAEFPSPQAVVLSIVKETRETKTLPSRNVIRLMPLSHVCYGSLEEMRAMAPKLLEGHFPPEGPAVAYAVDFDHRSADNFDRMTVINAFVDLIKPPHTVRAGARGRDARCGTQ